MSDHDGPGPVTELLAAHRAGDPSALERLVALVYGDLHRLARRQLASGGDSLTLDTTALVHEAYLKTLHREELPWHDRGHLLAVAAKAMRQLVIDHARARGAVKRGGDVAPLHLDEGRLAVGEHAEALLDLDAALTRLGEADEWLLRIVECRFFGGLTAEETAEALGSSLRTVERDWSRARAWLRVELADGAA